MTKAKTTKKASEKVTKKATEVAQAKAAVPVAAAEQATRKQRPAKANKPAKKKVTDVLSQQPLLHVLKTDQIYKGARASWYVVLQQHHGKTAAEFLEACTKSPPAMPKNGIPNNPRGWLGFFVRTGVAKVG